MIKVRQCSRLFKFLTNQIASYKRTRSSGCMYDEEYIRDTILNEQNRQALIRRLEKMSSSENLESRKSAAILLPLCVDNGCVSLLYTRRSAHLKLNAGQVSFPGGKIDDSDKSIADAALRECEEEIGLKRKHIQIWTTIKWKIQVHIVPIYPVIGFIKNYDPSKLAINRNEVQEVFTVPITKLLDPNNHGHTMFKSGWNSPIYTIEPTNVWGATAIFTDIFLASAFPELYKSMYVTLKK